MIGEYTGLYVAQASAQHLRLRKGGGIVTSLLLHLMEEKTIDEALVVTSSDEYPWAKAVVARTQEEISRAAGSKYTFVEYAHMARQLDQRSAMVGLPCQLRVTTACKVKIGVFCGLNISPVGYDYLFRKLGVDRGAISSLDYRAPDERYLHIALKDGTIVKYRAYYWLAFFFAYRKCLHCRDLTCHSADVAVGDFKEGWSCVVTRTDRGKKLVAEAADKGFIEAYDLSLEDFVYAKAAGIYQKEVMGGYCETRFVRQRGAWFTMLPLWLVKRMGESYSSVLYRRSRRYFDRERIPG